MDPNDSSNNTILPQFPTANNHMLIIKNSIVEQYTNFSMVNVLLLTHSFVIKLVLLMYYQLLIYKYSSLVWSALYTIPKVSSC